MTEMRPLASIFPKIVLGILDKVAVEDRPRYIEKLTDEHIEFLGFSSRDEIKAVYCERKAAEAA